MKPTVIHTGIFSIICAASLIIGSSTPAITATPIVPLVAIKPLTPQIVANFTNLYGQLLEVNLTPKQQQKISQRLTRDWMSKVSLRSSVMETLEMEPKIRDGLLLDKIQLQANFIGKLRQSVLDGDTDALWLVSFFDASPKNWLAAGEPPLTRMTTDMSADALCWMVNEIMGKEVATADIQLKDSIADKLSIEYPNTPNNFKQELSRLPTNWLKLKDSEWSQRGEDFREQMRVHWAKNLEAYIPEVRGMGKLRADRLAKLQADPTTPWDRLNSSQRQSALQKTEVAFQAAARALPRVQTVPINTYVNRMQVAKAIGNSPTRYPQSTLRVKW